MAARVMSGLTAATCGAFSVICLKVVAVAVPTFACEGRPPHYVFYIGLLGLATIAPLQLYLLNLSLAAGQATFAVPFYISLLMLMISLFGGLLFDEYVALLRTPRPLYAVLYAVGILCTAGGLFGLAAAQSYRQAMAAKKVEQQPDAANGSTADGSPTRLLSDGSIVLNA